MADVSPDATPTLAVAPLVLRARRATGPLVGRQVELGAIRQELAAAKSGRLTPITLKGISEPLEVVSVDWR